MNTPREFMFPLHNVIGFTEFFHALSHQKVCSYPPYDIRIVNEEQKTYQIVVAIAGFKKDEIQITKERHVLKISGAQKKDEAGEEVSPVQYQHKGIATRDFRAEFQLAEFVEVGEATIEHGLLTINLQQVVPESAKPRNIPISA
jgi:molecular chaperone IbpA